MVKTIVVLMVLGAAIVGGVYYFGGTRTMNPTKEGKAAKAKIKPGMKTTDVLAAIGSPKQWRVNRRVKKIIAGEEREIIEQGTALKFDKTLFEGSMKAGDCKEGFQWSYIYSYQAAFAVIFDGKGLVTGVEDEKTEADIYGTRDH